MSALKKREGGFIYIFFCFAFLSHTPPFFFSGLFSKVVSVFRWIFWGGGCVCIVVLFKN